MSNWPDELCVDSEVEAAARAAHAHEFIERLPQGYRSHLGDQGVRLSGGQRQRIAIARAILNDPAILLLDEATSALDNETEKEIVAEIQRLKGQKTLIVIAHRLTTLQHCDRIYRLEKGRIVAVGTPQQILRLPKGANA